MKKTSFAILTLTVAATVCFAAETPTTPKEPAVKAPAVVKAAAPANAAANFDFLPEVVAKVNGKKYTKAELIKNFMTAMGGRIPGQMPQETLKNIANSMAERFIQNTAVLDAALKAGYKPSPEMAVKEFKGFLKKLPEFQLNQIKKALAGQGQTLESFIEKNKDQKEFQERMAVGAFFEAEILSKCVVSDKDVKEYYDKNIARFTVKADAPDTMRASHILIAVKEGDDSKTKAESKAKAEKLLALLKKDATLFEELAEKESACPSGKQNKGSLGAFTKGRMVPEFEKAVVNLKPGEISAVVETSFGYHIIRRDPLQKETIEPFAKVKDGIKMSLEQEKKQIALEAAIKKIAEEAKGKNYLKK
jgi:parvulin-like peptidyl-prolyl isomerase